MDSVKFNLHSVMDGLEEVNYDTILAYFKEHHNHKLFVKKVNDEGSLVMIHNNLDTAKTNKLYQECRSIVYDVVNRKVLSYSHDNVIYMTEDKYGYINGDVVEESYEGTMIGVYEHGDKWHFSSTRCPDVNKSFYFNKKKSHGEMLDEVLKTIYPEIDDVREKLTEVLEKDKVYYFVLVHHENKYLVDYTKKFGEEYKKLVHIITRDKETQKEVTHKLNLSEVVYPIVFPSYEEAKYIMNTSVINTVNNTVEPMEGIIIKRYSEDSLKCELMKIPSNPYMILRYEKPNNLNMWLNCIEIFQRNNKNYTADMYMTKYGKTKEIKDIFGSGKHLDITGVLCAVIKCLSLEIMALYNHFTKYDKITGRYEKLNEEDFKMIEELKNLKVLKVTLNRLQNYQYKYYKDLYTMTAIVDHLRYHTTPEDIMELIKIHDYLRKENHNLFKIMNMNIANKDTIDRFMKTYMFYYENN